MESRWLGLNFSAPFTICSTTSTSSIIARTFRGLGGWLCSPLKLAMMSFSELHHNVSFVLRNFARNWYRYMLKRYRYLLKINLKKIYYKKNLNYLPTGTVLYMNKEKFRIHIKIRNQILSKLGLISGTGLKHKIFGLNKRFLTFLTCKQQQLCSQQPSFQCS